MNLRGRLEFGGVFVSAVGLGCAGRPPAPPSAPAPAPAADAGAPRDNVVPGEEPDADADANADAKWELEPPLAMAQCARELDGSREWRVVARALAAVDSRAGSSRRVATLLRRAQKQTLKLVARGALADLEGEVFLAELGYLREDRTPERRPPFGATCYSAPEPPDSAAAGRVMDRVPLLERLAVDGTLHPAVLCRIIGSLEQDLAQAEAVRERVLQALRTTNPSGPLCPPPDSPEERAEWERSDCRLVERLDRAVMLLKDLRRRLDALSTTPNSGG